MKKIIFIVLPFLLLVSCSLFETPEHRYVGLTRPEVPKFFNPPVDEDGAEINFETNKNAINGIIMVHEDGSLKLPAKEYRPEGKTLYSVHAYVAPNDTVTPNLSRSFSNFGIQVLTTGTPPVNAQVSLAEASNTDDAFLDYSYSSSLLTHSYSPSSLFEESSVDYKQASINYNLASNRAVVGERQNITTSGNGDQDIRNIIIECVASTKNADFFIEVEAFDVKKGMYVETSFKSNFNPYKAEYTDRFEQDYHTMIDTFAEPTSRVKVMIVGFPSGISGTIGNGGILVNINELLYGNTAAGLDYEDKVGLSVATVFHEMQHMLFRQARGASGVRAEPLWLEEGLSEYARDITTYDKENDVRLAFGSLGTKGLLSFGGSVPSDTRNSYSLSYLFVQYLVDRYGLDIIDRLYDPGPPLGSEPDAEPRGDGVHALSASTGIPFHELYFDFAIAVAINGLIDYNDYSFDVIPKKYRFETLFRKTNSAGEFVDDELVTVVAIPAVAGGTGAVDGGDIRQVKNHLNPYAVKVYRWEGDVDSISVPVPVNTHFELIKSAVFYAD